jgi:XTP/dITP diphosphohydrolase
MRKETEISRAPAITYSQKMASLLLATRNPHKTAEFMRILGPDFEVHDLRTHPEIGEIEENGETFEANARLKAIAVSQQATDLVVADDSGLEVDALGGNPGVRSARFAGEGATDAANRAKLLGALSELTAASPWKARFRCLLALAQSGTVIATFDGKIEGDIMSEERGEGGFGYDPLFRPRGSEKTFAEMSPGNKDRLSHRGAAIAQLIAFLRKHRLG